MKFVTPCEHPKSLLNPYTHEWVTVPCNHCDACKMSHSYVWTQRIEHECLSNDNSLFFTLTYNEDNVPKLYADFCPEHSIYFYNSNTLSEYHKPFADGEYLDLKDLGKLSFKDYDFCIKHDFINVLSKRHVQLFMKRLRRKVSYNYGSSCKLRYFICGEYGSEHKRPHYHGILWFPSESDLKSKITEYVSACWKYGFTDSSFVRNSSSAYVAQYVNCISHLPKVYSHPLIRPFFLCSKQPPIGSLYFDDSTLLQMFLVGNPTFKGLSKGSKQLIDIPNWRFVENTLFPKVQRFSELSDIGRVAVYGLCKISACEEKHSFKAWCKNQVSKYSTPLTQYLRLIGVRPYGDILSYEESNRENNALSRLYSVSNRVVYNCVLFGIDIHLYVRFISHYYDRKELERLRQWYLFQSDFVRKGGDVRELIHCDVSLENRVVNSNILQKIVVGYGFHSLAEFRDFTLDKSHVYNEMKSFFHMLSHNSHKVKAINDDLDIINNNLIYLKSKY